MKIWRQRRQRACSKIKHRRQRETSAIIESWRQQQWHGSSRKAAAWRQQHGSGLASGESVALKRHHGGMASVTAKQRSGISGMAANKASARNGITLSVSALGVAYSGTA